MRVRTIASRLQRLEELKALLKDREGATTSVLAAELEVSLRTLQRDLAVLRESGVPIEADRGRGGGLRLQRNWALGRLHLSAEESIDLLLALAVAERVKSPLLLRRLASVRRKIVAAFAGYELKVRSLRKRVLVGSPATAEILATFSLPQRGSIAGIAEAFFAARCVAIEYIDQRGAATSRVVEPQFLYLSLPIWYVLGWDRLRGAIRYFRLDRIKTVRLLEDRFRLADPRPYLEQAERGIESLQRRRLERFAATFDGVVFSGPAPA